MHLDISANAELLAKKAAGKAAEIIHAAVQANDETNIVIATGASHLEFYKALIPLDIPWEKVNVFHLDEYIGISEEHKASFKKYIKDNFASKLNLKSMNYISASNAPDAEVERLNQLVRGKTFSLGVIGIGENAHIAFNDPPADFENKAPFAIVTLDEACRKQQAGEGWFDTLEAVPERAISATVSFIMSFENIVSVVPHKVKANAVAATLNTDEVTNKVPASILKTHKNWNVYLDDNSAALLKK